MDLPTIVDYQENIYKSSIQLISKINNRIHYLENNPDLTSNQIMRINLDLRKFFINLKTDQINQIEIFNKLANLKLDDGTNVLKIEDRIKMIKNINISQSTLSKYLDLLPDLNLKLDSLPELNVNIERPISPLEKSIVEVESLNTTIEDSWKQGSNLSPQSDETIKPSK